MIKKDTGICLKEKIVHFLSDKPYIALLFNHVLVLYTFFLPLSKDGRRSSFIVLVLLYLFHGNIKEKLLFALKNRVIQVMVLLFALYALGAIGASNTEEAIESVNRMKPLLIPLILYPLIQTKFLPRLFMAFFLGMSINEIMSYGIYFELLPNTLSHEGDANNPSPFNYTHLAYGYTLSITFGFLLYQFITSHGLSKIQKSIMLFFLMTITVNMFFNVARIGYVLYSVVTLTVILFIYRAHLLKALTGIFVFIALVYSLALTLSPNVQHKTQQTFDEIQKLSHNDHDSSFGWRVAMWKLGFEAFKETPVFGHGSGQYIGPMTQIAEEKHPEFLHIIKALGTNMHNAYISTAVQLGLIGLSVYLFLFFQMYRYLQPNSEQKILILILMTSSLTYSFVGDFFKNLPALIFVSLLTYALIPKKGSDDLNPITTKTILQYSFAGIILFIIGLMT